MKSDFPLIMASCVYIHQPMTGANSEQPDYRECAMVSARMAARALTRLANRKLKPYGYTAPQFSLLAAIHSAREVSIPALAEELAMERTTLIRNLRLLEERGLVAPVDPDKGSRSHKLTPEGKEALNNLVPLWRAFQQDLRDQFGAENIRNSVKTMRRLSGRE